jgi:hypothetical protein
MNTLDQAREALATAEHDLEVFTAAELAADKDLRAVAGKRGREAELPTLRSARDRAHACAAELRGKLPQLRADLAAVAELCPSVEAGDLGPAAAHAA